MELTAENVKATLDHCLFGEMPEPGTEFIRAEGIIRTAVFHPDRLEEKREDVRSMLMQLPVEFIEKTDDAPEGAGGGWSFLNACLRADGVHWGEHPWMDALFMLGAGLGLAANLMEGVPKNVLPGGMPYYVVLMKPRNVARSTMEGSDV
ncbi:MAG: hypothetical protein WBG86_14560 [Polyangiales bacterium]